MEIVLFIILAYIAYKTVEYILWFFIG